jgi:diguanylate cyclase (GGDEF)-like protein/PAS domain S-box-containing protein
MNCDRVLSGQDFPEESCSEPANDSEAQPEHYRCLCQQASNPIKAMEERCRTLLNSATLMMWSSASDGLCNFFNQSWLTFTGRTLEQELGEGWLEGVHPEDKEYCLSTYQSAFDARQDFEMEYRLRRADGEYRWIRDRGAPLWEPDGSFEGYAGSCFDITEQKQAEAVLNHSNQLFRALAENAPDIITRFDRQLRHLYVNPAAQGVSGMSPQEFIGKTNRELGLPEPQVSLWETVMQRVFASGCEEVMEFEFFTPSGQKFYQARVVPEFSDSGLVEMILCVTRDITELHRVQEALLKSQEKLSLHVQQTPLAIIEWDTDLEITEWNPAAEAIFGYRKAEIIESSWQALVPLEARERVLQVFKDLLTLKQGIQCTNENLTKDGRTITCEWYNTPLIDQEGNVVGIASLAQDISQRRRVEEALRISEYRYYSLARLSPVGIYRTDAEGGCLYVNKRWCEMTGLTLGEALEDGWLCTVHPDDRERVVSEWQQAVREQRSFQSEWRLLHPNGAIAWIVTQAVTEVGDSGTVVGYVGTLTDITESKLAEAALRQQTERERLMVAIQGRIRASLNLEEILNTAVVEVRQLLECDRVVIYRLLPDKTGSITTEAVLSDYPAILGSTFPKEAISKNWYQYYCQGKLRVINELGHYDSDSKLFEQMHPFGVKAALRAPLLENNKLWGLLIAHQCTAPRFWQPFEEHLLSTLATSLSVAIQQAQLYQRLEAANQELQRQVSLDGLTQIANRRRFDEHLEYEWRRLSREQAPLALILCDIDYFKLYNDTYGHLVGDRCLQEVAQAINSAVKRPADLVARYGGEEFAVILPHTKAHGAIFVAEKIRTLVRRLHIAHAHSPAKEITLSLGITVTVPSPKSSLEQLITTSDQALYEAKAQGRDRLLLKPCPE